VVENKLPIRLVTDLEGSEGYVLIRSEDIILSNDSFESSATNNFQGTITEIIPGIRGTEVVVDADILFHALITPASLQHLELKEGKRVWLHFKATAVKFIPA
jgi:molybdopterin-binding protein